MGDFNLKDKFNRLFQLENRKNVKVSERGIWEAGKWVWVWDWARELRGRGIGDFNELTALLHSFSPSVGQKDKWVWNLVDHGCFTVKELRSLIDSITLGSTGSQIETKWNKLIPRKVCILSWRIQQRRLPVRFWLDHIGMDLHSIIWPAVKSLLKWLIIASFLART